MVPVRNNECWIECNIQLQYPLQNDEAGMKILEEHLRLARILQRWLHRRRYLWCSWHYLFEPEGMRFRVRTWWWSKQYLQRGIASVLEHLSYEFYFGKGRTIVKDHDYDDQDNYVGEPYPDWKERQQILRWGSELALNQFRSDIPISVHCLMNQTGGGRRWEQMNYLWWFLCGRNDDLQLQRSRDELTNWSHDIRTAVERTAVESGNLSDKKFALVDREVPEVIVAPTN